MSNGIPKDEWVDVSIDKDFNISRRWPDVNPNVEVEHCPEFQYQVNTVLGDSETWHKGLPKGYAWNYQYEVYKVVDAKKAVAEVQKEVDEGTVFIDSNPKTAFGAVKPGTFQTPPMPLYEYSLAHYQGALKYGHMNWREDPVSTSTYINAARRHIDLYMEGQKYSSDTGDTPNGVRGIHNLGHAMTCLSIVMDAEFYGTLIDDRSEFGAAEKLEQYFEETKKLQQHLMKTWTGHSQQLKDKIKK